MTILETRTRADYYILRKFDLAKMRSIELISEAVLVCEPHILLKMCNRKAQCEVDNFCISAILDTEYPDFCVTR
jgi:hypothetical protein